jgi:transcriptional regulator GlxA family with amidase domain
LEQIGFSRVQLDALGAAASLVRVSHAAARRLAAAALDAIDLIQNTAVPSGPNRSNDVERVLLAILFAAIGSGDTSSRVVRPAISSSLDRIHHQAVAFFRMQDGLDVNVEHLCRAIDATERSLLRAFHRFFGVGPAQYMKLRRLNRVHRELLAPDCKEATVTAVMTSCGVTEFGRFAGTYRALFGETPSETLKRKLEAAGRMRAEVGPNLRRLQTQRAEMWVAS